MFHPRRFARFVLPILTLAPSAQERPTARLPARLGGPDTNAYQHRWTTWDGQRICTNDPHRVRELSNVEWQSTPVRAR